MLLEGSMNRAARNTGGTCDAYNPSIAQGTGISGQEDAALLLIQMGQDRRKSLCKTLVIIHDV